MDQELLRREQYYLVNRNRAGETTAESIIDYGVRRDLVLAKAYLEGRLTGLPTLGEKEDFERTLADILERLK
jgi:hypothetical protein